MLRSSSLSIKPVSCQKSRLESMTDISVNSLISIWPRSKGWVAVLVAPAAPVPVSRRPWRLGEREEGEREGGGGGGGGE